MTWSYFTFMIFILPKSTINNKDKAFKGITVTITNTIISIIYTVIVFKIYNMWCLIFSEWNQNSHKCPLWIESLSNISKRSCTGISINWKYSVMLMGKYWADVLVLGTTAFHYQKIGNSIHYERNYEQHRILINTEVL